MVNLGLNRFGQALRIIRRDKKIRVQADLVAGGAGRTRKQGTHMLLKSCSRRTPLGAFLALALYGLAACTYSPVGPDTPPSGVTTVDQGPEWTNVARNDFYSHDQGSQIMPLAWMLALKGADHSGFLSDGLKRYGYLPNNAANSSGLPVGFTKAGPQGGESVGMSCAACHTRQIEVGGASYRIDGGPAIVDFQQFLLDLDDAVLAVLASDEAFAAFSKAVLQTTPGDPAQLRKDVTVWSRRFHTLMVNAVPKDHPWGLARLDAVGMIFDRLTGLDIGPPENDYIIEKNIRPASAPARYPFLWNAATQDRTQWPGFASNGNDLFGLARNTGEVFGVFALFHPVKAQGWFGEKIDYLHTNSANFEGLGDLEDLIRRIAPPKWPWPWGKDHDASVERGKNIFMRSADRGGCGPACHEKKETSHLFGPKTWATPVQNVGTDTHEWDIVRWTADSGVLEGSTSPLSKVPLGAHEHSFDLLGSSVTGSILQKFTATAIGEFFRPLIDFLSINRKQTGLKAAFPHEQPVAAAQSNAAAPTKAALRSSSATPLVITSDGAANECAGEGKTGCYEARVLEGIWATAPYLHNGSVPTLADLLEPVDKRPAEFAVGAAYDTDRIGLAAQQPGQATITRTTDCSELNSGNSRCGHLFGTTTLTADEKKDLLEYLKQL